MTGNYEDCILVKIAPRDLRSGNRSPRGSIFQRFFYGAVVFKG